MGTMPDDFGKSLALVFGVAAVTVIGVGGLAVYGAIALFTGCGGA